MEIQTKFNIDDVVWFMHNNMAKKASVVRINIVVNCLFEKDLKPQIRYLVDNDLAPVMDECEIFKSKEELLASL